MQHTRPRAVRTAALVAGAGLISTTWACLAAGSAHAGSTQTPAQTPLGFTVAAIAAAPGGGVVAVGSVDDEEDGTSSPHAAIVKDGTVTPIRGLPDSGRASAVTVADGEIHLGTSDDSGTELWVVSPADPTLTATDDGGPSWQDLSALAATEDGTVLAGGTGPTGDAVVSGSAGTTELAESGYVAAMAASGTDGEETSYTVGYAYVDGTATPELWVTGPEGDVDTYPAGTYVNAVADAGGVAYVADQAVDTNDELHNEIRAVDTATGDVTVLPFDASLITGLATSPDEKTLYVVAGSSLYAVPVDGFADFDAADTDDYLYAEGGLDQLALSGTAGHLTAYSTTSFDDSGDAAVQLDAPAAPTFTAAPSAEDKSAIVVRLPGSATFDGYSIALRTGGRSVAVTPECEDDYDAGTDAVTSTCTIDGLARGVTYDVTVTHANILGATAGEAQSVATPGLLPGPSRVSFTGTAQVGRTLTAAVGSGWPAGTTFTYAWGWNGGQMGGLAGTGRTFTVPAGLAGRQLQLIVTGRKGTEDREVRSAFATVRAGSLTVATPRVTGKAKVGKRLTAVAGTWTAGTTLRYQWYAGAKALEGSTGRTLKLTRKLKGKKVSVRVTGTKAGYTSATRASTPLKVR